VAIEAQYHKKSYQKYTRCLSKKTEQFTASILYDEAFDKFCKEIVQKRLINNKEILLLSYLLKQFVNCVEDLHDTAVVPYQATLLKKRIMLRYPQILFHASKTINKGTLVYADIIVPGDIADDLMEFDASVDTDDKLQDMESYIESKFDNVSNVLLTSYFMLQWK
jgi:hypothetical protein